MRRERPGSGSDPARHVDRGRVPAMRSETALPAVRDIPGHAVSPAVYQDRDARVC